MFLSNSPAIGSISWCHDMTRPEEKGTFLKPNNLKIENHFYTWVAGWCYLSQDELCFTWGKFKWGSGSFSLSSSSLHSPLSLWKGILHDWNIVVWDFTSINNLWAATCDFQQCGILIYVDSNEPLQPPFKLRNTKWCSVSSLTIIEYSSD